MKRFGTQWRVIGTQGHVIGTQGHVIGTGPQIIANEGTLALEDVSATCRDHTFHSSTTQHLTQHDAHAMTKIATGTHLVRARAWSNTVVPCTSSGESHPRFVGLGSAGRTTPR